jgi:hypothetical protein
MASSLTGLVHPKCPKIDRLPASGSDASGNRENQMMVVRGVCLCQIVGFEVDLPFIKFVKCHCSRCRRATGSAFAANAYVLPSAFRWTRGQENVGRFDLPEARSFSTSFCRLCGSPLPHSTRSGREVIIPAGALIDNPRVSPSIESCWSSRAPWLSDAINLPTTD